MTSHSHGRIEISLDKIQPNPWQTRQVSPEKVAALAADIRQNGLLQPPVGRVVNLAGELAPMTFWGEYTGLPAWLGKRLEETGFTVQIAFGHHRLAAFRDLVGDGLTPDYVERFGCFPIEIQDLSDEQMALFGWSENEQRGDLTDIEKAQAMQRYMTDFDWTQEQVAKKLGLSRSTVANKIRMFKLQDNSLTLPVFEAWRDGKISERQAMAALPLVDQPEGVLERSEKSAYEWMRPSRVVQQIARGDVSSDVIRSKVDDAIEQSMVSLQSCKFLKVAFEGPGFASPTCQDCPLRVPSKRNNAIFMCQQAACYEKKNQVWRERAAAAAIAKSGLPLLTGAGSGEYKDFWGEDREIIEHVYAAQPCEHMALKEGEYGAKVPGVEGYELVCHHGKGKRCTCLAAELRRRKKEDPKELERAENRKKVKVLRGQAESVVGAALLAGSQAAWYALWSHYNRYSTPTTIKPEDTTEAITRDFVRRMMEGKLVQWEENPPQTQEMINELLARMSLTADGSEISPAAGAWAKFQRIAGWMHDLVREFPLTAMVKGNIANLEKLVDVPGLETAQWQQIAAARDQLEALLPVIEGWTADDRFDHVSWLVTTPPGDINFRSHLADATLPVLQYALVLIPVEKNEVKIVKLEQRIRKLTPKTLAEVFADEEAKAVAEAAPAD